MGWSSFQVKRSKDGVDLGEMTIIVPKMSVQHTVETGYNSTGYTLSDLLALEDFPIEANLFCYSETEEELLKSVGFANAINLTPYIGEKWTLNNGSYFTVTKANSNTLELTPCLSNGDTAFLGGNLFSISKAGQTTLSACYAAGLYGETQECQIGWMWVVFSGTDKGRVRFAWNPLPYVVQDLNFYKDAKPIYTTNDPYGDGGASEPGGGGGSFDNTSTPIQIPGLPSISAASTGFISLFNPTLNQLNDLASYMWSDLFQVEGWKKLFADPMDAILGLSIVPVAVPSGGTREVKVGNIGTGISLTVASSQFVEVDCGSIDVNEYWGAYLDYEPYTQAQIFLPYIGIRPISVDEIMGKTVRVVYHVDILTGACCCFVKCGDSVLYTYNGQCSIPIPITGANYASVVNGVISVAASVGSLVATGGSSAPTAIPAIASSAVNQMKPQVEKSGSISGSAGVLNMQTPFLILIRPRQALPFKQNEFIGYPSLITVQLTELSGYTEVQSIHLDNIPATQEELAEIESLLKGGVIF